MNISVIVCTFNGKNRLGSCLSALIAQEYAPEFEVIVVDNASTDGTNEYVSSFFNSFPKLIPFTIVKESKPGLLNARLAGLYVAKFDWVLFCDDDNVVSKDFLIKCSGILEKNDRIGVLGSKGVPEFLGTKPEWFDLYYSSYAVGPQNNLGNTNVLGFVYGACSTFRKKPLLNLFENGFIPILSGRKGKEMSSGDDVEWCYLMQLSGFQIKYSDSLIFTHKIPQPRLSWKYFLKLKGGISSNAGIFSSYQVYWSNRKKSPIGFIIKYVYKGIFHFTLYIKYSIKWRGAPKKKKDQLAFEIIKSKNKSFLSQFFISYRHFIQLKDYFGS